MRPAVRRRATSPGSASRAGGSGGRRGSGLSALDPANVALTGAIFSAEPALVDATALGPDVCPE